MKKTTIFLIFLLSIYNIGFLLYAIFNISSILEYCDFQTFYRSIEIFLEDPSQLYFSRLNGTNSPFRYFPIAIFLYFPYKLFSLEIAYFINIFVTIFYKYLIFYNIKKIYGDRFNRNYQILLLGFMFTLLNIWEIHWGGNVTLASLFLVLSFKYSKKKNKKNDLLMGIWLGMALLLKPFFLLLYPFIITIKFNLSIIKENILRLLFTIIIGITTIFYFVIFPESLIGFINQNIKFTENARFFNASGSLSNILLFFFKIENTKLLYYIILIVFCSVPIILFLIDKEREKNNLFYFNLIVLAILLSWYHVWEGYLYFIAVYLLMFCIENEIYKLYIYFLVGIILNYIINIIICFIIGYPFQLYIVIPILNIFIYILILRKNNIRILHFPHKSKIHLHLT